jgi:radical SAM superfamily enzyme YgiQ (UPF0313 family)
MPMGTLALADLLEKNGFSAKVYHTGIEQMYNRNFKVEELFKQYDPKVVGIDLHWFVHSYDAIKIAELAKYNSNAFVVFGGFTASYFSEEIMNQHECVDAIIRGDAEEPLLRLMEKLPRSDMDNIPNLIYRDNAILKQSNKEFVADEESLGKLCYTNFHLLSNYDKYLRTISQSGDLDPYAWKVVIKNQAWVPLGRGCTTNCSYCGGGAKAQYTLNKRHSPIFHPKEQILETLTVFEEKGIDSTYMDFDPYIDRKFFHELFELIRKEKVDISTEFALWSTSKKSFIEDFSRTFNPLYSTLVLSPESGSEQVRKKNKGFYFDNQELFQWMSNAKNEMVPLEIYFASGLSWETQENFEETIELAMLILEDYPIVAMSCNALVMEPASPRFLQPDKFGVKLKFKKFTDFYNHFRRLATGMPVESKLGYETKWQTEDQIIGNSFRFIEKIGLGQPSRWLDIKSGNELLRFRDT